LAKPFLHPERERQATEVGHFWQWCVVRTPITIALCPDNISGGKLLWRGARKVKNRPGHIFRLAGFSLHHSLTPLGNYLPE
jgi:hypothetical protein